MESNGSNGEVLQLQINDQNVYEFICQKGHRNALVHQEQKFELLFESALYAIKDGYLREAISSIASGMERFYEFAVKVICAQNNIPIELVEEGWKQMSKQSERQLGAFIFQYLSEFKEMPPLLRTKQVEFRNNVIHKGYFPDYDETIAFGEDVLEIIFAIVIKLKQKCEAGMNSVVWDRMIKMNGQAHKISKEPMVLSSPTIIRLLDDISGFKSVKLVDYLQRIPDKRNR